MKSRSRREYELSFLLLNDKPALHREFQRVIKRLPRGETDRALVVAILGVEFPIAESQSRAKRQATG